MGCVCDISWNVGDRPVIPPDADGQTVAEDVSEASDTFVPRVCSSAAR